MIYGFEPIIANDCEILILGSMPGVESIKMQQYYGNKRNNFWNIIFNLFGKEVDEDYEEKKNFLICHRIALWDILKNCDRQGSSDSNIKNAFPNDFKWLFENHPNIKNIYFNGKKAQALYKKFVLENTTTEQVLFTVLPSTSPANTVTFEEKICEWKVILGELK